MDIIKNCLGEPDEEYVLFGDEKNKNIYDNELENKDIKTNVQQRPSEMKDCFRVRQENQKTLLSTFKSGFSSISMILTTSIINLQLHLIKPSHITTSLYFARQ
ncbi:MAG: hypothetical protein M5U17_17320 [Ignavibacterium sp.]|nr:hypothetical protein [Ignavibacterium sp.]